MDELMKYELNVLRAENEDLKAIVECLEKQVNELKKQNYTLEERCKAETKARDGWRQTCYRRSQRICDLMKEKADLEKQLEEVRRETEDLKAKMDDSLGICKIRQLEELEEEIGNLREKNKQLNNDNTALQHTVDDFVVKCENLQSAYDKEHSRWVELAENYDRLETKYRRLEREHSSVKLTGMGELWAMIREVNSAPIEAIYGSGAFNNKICAGTILNMYPDVRDFVKEYKAWKGCTEETDKYIQKLNDDTKELGYKQGQTDLWEKLKEASENISADPIIRHSISVEDFLKKYEAWKSDKEEKETERMRNWLSDFCVGRLCTECPLGSAEFKCGNGYSFKRRDRFDLRIIPDEDIKRYYEKARGCGRFSWPDEKEENSSEEVPCSFDWKLDGTEFTIETSIPRKDYDNIVKIISGKE